MNDKFIYVIGGLDYKQDNFLERYDIDGDVWEVIELLNKQEWIKPTFEMFAHQIDDTNILIMGGDGTNNCYVFDTENNQL